MEKLMMVTMLWTELKFITELVLTHSLELELMKLTMPKIKLIPNLPLPLWLTSENNKMLSSNQKKEDMNTLSLFLLMPQISLTLLLLVKPVFLNYLPTPWPLLPRYQNRCHESLCSSHHTSCLNGCFWRRCIRWRICYWQSQKNDRWNGWNC